MPRDTQNPAPVKHEEKTGFIPAGRPGVPNPIDIHVGQRIRQRRILLGFSQQKLADAIGLTFQQIQKYERGTNRCGASRLWDLADVLNVEITYFFGDMPPEISGSSPRLRAGVDGHIPEDPDIPNDTLARREILELARYYNRIKDKRVRRKVFDLTKSLATSED